MNRLIQISDIHLVEDINAIEKGRSPSKQLERALLDMEQKIPGEKTIIITGDLVSSITTLTYQQLAGLFDKINHPIYVIPGNHDDPVMLKEHFVGKNIFHKKEIELDGWVALLLDSSTPGVILGSGRLSDLEMAKTEELLIKHRNKNIVIFIHHPPILFGATWFQNNCLENNKEFLKLIKNFDNIKIIAFGHAHTQHTEAIDGKIYFGAPSCWIQVDHTVNENIAYSNVPGGYNWFWLAKSGEFGYGTHFFHTP